MDENEMMEPVMPEHEIGEEPNPVDYTAPFRAAKQQREDSASVIAEHDNLLADVLFELTMQEMEG